MVSGDTILEEMPLSNRGRILSAPEALSFLSFPSNFIIMSSEITILDSVSYSGYGKLIVLCGMLDVSSLVNTDEKYLLNS